MFKKYSHKIIQMKSYNVSYQEEEYNRNVKYQKLFKSQDFFLSSVKIQPFFLLLKLTQS